ncbi:MAG: carbohydrate ABC transporter permease [Sphaerochaeta sp.]|jgi:multiple sugar transport system permease protein|nr:carbohydrate ABC transporter permease [Sphaerochaeta sp.]MDX9915892.1 carbohydrate ABC transporter permease [Sphaerochaeta sp.]
MKRRSPYPVIRFLLLALYLIAAIFPLYWIFITSLKGPKEIYTMPLQYLPNNPSLASYRKLFSFSNFSTYFRNSLVIALISSLLAMAVSIFSGFSLSRYPTKRTKGALQLVLYFTQTIPTFIIMVPIFTMFSRLGWVDRTAALMLVYVATVVAFSTIMSKGFFDRIPTSLEEAARIDGCSMFQSLWRVILPITRPGMAAIFCFAFINIWNELFLAVMLLMSNDKMTVPVALNSFISKAGISWDVMSAGIVIALLPTMIVFGFGQRYIVAGLTEGSVKG